MGDRHTPLTRRDGPLRDRGGTGPPSVSCLGVTLLHAPGPSGRDSLLSNDKRRRRACVNTAAPQSLSSEPAHCHSGSLVEASSQTKPEVKGGPRSLCGRVYELEGQERGHQVVGGCAGGEILYSARVQTACHMDRRDSVGSAGTERWGSSSNGPVCCSLRFKLHCGPLGTASPGQAAFPPPSSHVLPGQLCPDRFPGWCPGIL